MARKWPEWNFWPRLSDSRNSHTKPFFSKAEAERCYSLHYSQSEIWQSKIKNWVSFTDKVPRTSKTTSTCLRARAVAPPQPVWGYWEADWGLHPGGACEDHSGPPAVLRHLQDMMVQKRVTLYSRLWTLASNVECVAAKMEMKCFLSRGQRKVKRIVNS